METVKADDNAKLGKTARDLTVPKSDWMCHMELFLIFEISLIS